MFTDFNRQGHKMLSAEISSALAGIAAKHGLQISVGGGNIGSDELKINVIAKTTDTSTIEAAAMKELAAYGRYYGLQADDYGAIFTASGKRFKLTGVSPNRPKYPLDGECLQTGKRFKFTESSAKQIIAARTATPPAPSMPAPTGNGFDPRYAGSAQF